MQRLIELLRSYESVAIGFSGGVDSTFLAAVCVRALPPSHVHLIHLDTPLVGTPERASFERERERFERLGAHVVSIAVDPLSDPTVAKNPADRCYHCKRLGFQRIMDAAHELGAHVVLEGSNADDAGDYRPGTRAVRELGAKSPLMETGWSKAEEREVLRAWGTRCGTSRQEPVWQRVSPVVKSSPRRSFMLFKPARTTCIAWGLSRSACAWTPARRG